MKRAVVAAVALAVAGCTSVAVHRITTPPGETASARALRGRMEAMLGVRREAIALPDGSRVSVSTVEPGAHRATYTVRRTRASTRFDFDVQPGAEPVTARIGTVVMLPGWGTNAASLLPWAVALSRQGYRVELIDLQQGATGVPVGYGPSEADTLARLVEQLRSRDRIVGPLHVVGVSYGAAIALHAEPMLVPRPASIVAIEPCGRPADAIARLAHHAAPVLSRHARMARAIDRAGRRLGADLERLDTADALRASSTCTLLIAGGLDDVVPVTEIRRLHAAAPHLPMFVASSEDHFTLPARADWLATPLAQWMQVAAAGRCTAFEPGVDPVVSPP